MPFPLISARHVTLPLNISYCPVGESVSTGAPNVVRRPHIDALGSRKRYCVSAGAPLRTTIHCHISDNDKQSRLTGGLGSRSSLLHPRGPGYLPARGSHFQLRSQSEAI